MEAMRRHSVIAAVLALALPLATPAAAWSVGQCCAAGPLATLVAPAEAPEGHCHEAPEVTNDDGAALAVDLGAGSDCRMDHLAVRGAAPAPDAALGIIAFATVLVDATAVDASPRTAAGDRGPPASLDLNL